MVVLLSENKELIVLINDSNQDMSIVKLLTREKKQFANDVNLEKKKN